MPKAASAFLVPLAMLAGCGRQAPPPAPAAPPRPATCWTAATSDDLAARFVEVSATAPWAIQLRDRSGRAVRVAVGAIEDRTSDQLPVADIAAALAQALDAHATFDRAGDSPAEVQVAGRIGGGDLEAAADGPVRRFAVDLRVLDAQGEALAPFSIELTVADPR